MDSPVLQEDRRRGERGKTAQMYPAFSEHEALALMVIRTLVPH
jgi:hypothetical protein